MSRTPSVSQLGTILSLSVRSLAQTTHRHYRYNSISSQFNYGRRNNVWITSCLLWGPRVPQNRRTNVTRRNRNGERGEKKKERECCMHVRSSGLWRPTYSQLLKYVCKRSCQTRFFEVYLRVLVENHFFSLSLSFFLLLYRPDAVH